MNNSLYPTEEDMRLVKEYIELPFVLDVLESNAQKSLETFRIPEIFALFLTKLQDQVNQDLKEIRMNMRKRGIKILEEQRQKDGVFIKYQCRGYVKEFRMLYGVLKSRLEQRLADYLGVDVNQLER